MAPRRAPPRTDAAPPLPVNTAPATPPVYPGPAPRDPPPPAPAPVHWIKFGPDGAAESAGLSLDGLPAGATECLQDQQHKPWAWRLVDGVITPLV